MSAELAFIAALRAHATHPAARGLMDDVAVIETNGGKLVLTQDTLVDSVHFLPHDSPEDVAWKLAAVNLSDLAAKGATPRYALLSYTLGTDPRWDQRFAAALGSVLDGYGVALIGGDTVSAPQRSLTLTLIGEANGNVPGRSGAQIGDGLYVTGTIGDSGAGLACLREAPDARGPLVDSYRRPVPQLVAGQILAVVATAMMDVSDGLLIDAGRLASASGLAALIDLGTIPLSDAFRHQCGEDRQARLMAATAGDDYQLLFTSTMPLPASPVPVTRIGHMVRGEGVRLIDNAGPVALPVNLGWLHGLP